MRATTLVLFLGLVAVCGGNAPNARGQQDFAVQQLNNPPRTAVSSRVKREMERLRERGMYGADLREMLARGSLERTAEGDLIRADRIKNPRERVAALERVLSEKIHPNNLLYQLRVLQSIRWEAGKVPVSRQEMNDLTLRWADLNRRICEVKVAGYGRSTPLERFEEDLADAERCLASACDTLAKLQQPCSRESEPAVALEPKRPDPSTIDPSGGELDESVMFYVVGVRPGSSLTLRSRPSAGAATVGSLSVGRNTQVYRSGRTGGDTTDWENICTVDGLCGWVESWFVSQGSSLASARQAVDYYLMGLLASSLRGMLDLTTGEAYESIEALYNRDPDGSASDYSDASISGWNGECAVCKGRMCQALFRIRVADNSKPDDVVFQTERGDDGKTRVASTRAYAGEVKEIFDSLHPYCWE